MENVTICIRSTLDVEHEVGIFHTAEDVLGHSYLTVPLDTSYALASGKNVLAARREIRRRAEIADVPAGKDAVGQTLLHYL